MNQNTKFIYNSLHSDHFKLKYSKSGYLPSREIPSHQLFGMQFRSLSSRIETITSYPIPTACVEIIVSKSTGRKSFGGKHRQES